MTKAEATAKVPTNAELLEQLREIENPHEQTIAQIEELYQVIFRIQAGKVKASAIDRFNELINRAKERHLTFAKTKTLIASYYTQAIGGSQTSLPSPLLVNMYGYLFHALAVSLSCVTIILCELKNLFTGDTEIHETLRAILLGQENLNTKVTDHDARTTDDHRRQDADNADIKKMVKTGKPPMNKVALARLFGVTRQTIDNWCKPGRKPEEWPGIRADNDTMRRAADKYKARRTITESDRTKKRNSSYREGITEKYTE